MDSLQRNEATGLSRRKQIANGKTEQIRLFNEEQWNENILPLKIYKK